MGGFCPARQARLAVLGRLAASTSRPVSGGGQAAAVWYNPRIATMEEILSNEDLP
jgi:hypothetical protein